MSLGDLLQQIVGAAGPTPTQVDEVAQNANREQVQGGVAAALGSAGAPQLSNVVAELFAKSTPEQRAAILNAITERLGAGALANVAGGVLAGHEGTGTPAVSADETAAITPDHVRDVVDAATAQDPGLLQRVSSFYAEHPALVKTLGSGLLMVALAHMKNNMGKR